MTENKNTTCFSLNNTELFTQMSSLEFLMRMLIGQFGEINWHVRLNAAMDQNDWSEVEAKEARRQELLTQIREVMMPELSGMPLSGSHGIYSPAVKPAALDAYDLLQVLRFKEAWYRMPEGGITVNFRSPSIRGRYPKPEVIMFDNRENASAQITVTVEQGIIMRDSAILYHYLTEQNFEELFRFLSEDNPEVMKIVPLLNETKINSLPAEEKENAKALVKKLSELVADAGKE